MAGIFRATILMSQYGSTYANVLHFRKPSSSPNDLTDLASAVNAWVVVNPLSLHADGSVRWFNLHVQEVVNDGESADFPIDVSGALGPNVNQNPNIAAVIQLRTENGGRRGRGRFFLAGWDTRAKNSGFWSDGALLEGNAVAQALEDFWVNTGNPNYKNTGFEWVVASRDQGENGTAFGVTSIKFRATPGVVRRRGIGVGS